MKTHLKIYTKQSQILEKLEFPGDTVRNQDLLSDQVEISLINPFFKSRVTALRKRMALGIVMNLVSSKIAFWRYTKLYELFGSSSRSVITQSHDCE
jgi:hypothetical protein